MELSKREQELQKQLDYNEVPVYYCTDCLSLKIMNYSEDTAYCDDCGCTEVKTTHISEWDLMYKNKYKKDYIKK